MEDAATETAPAPAETSAEGAPRARQRIAPVAVQPVAPTPPPAAAPAAKAAPKKKAEMSVPGQSSLAEVMASVAKLHGPNIMRRATDALMVLPHYSTGIFTLDMALLGGVVQSGITEIYGWEQAGKTTVANRVVASAQAKYPDMDAVYIDQEGTLDAAWAQAHGIDIDRLTLVQPEYGEQAMDILDAVIRSRDCSIVVLDSLPALVPLKELNDSAEDQNVALQARLIGKAVRKASQAILDERKRAHYPAVVCINQWRQKIVTMGDNRNLPGGNAIKFFMHTRFEVLKKEVMGEDAHGQEVVDFNEHSFKIAKCKAGSSLKIGAWDMVRNSDHPLGAGFIDEGETVLSFARKFGYFTGGGSSWRFDDVDHRFNKLSEAVTYLYENEEYYLGLKRRLISAQRERVGQRPTDWW